MFRIKENGKRYNEACEELSSPVQMIWEMKTLLSSSQLPEDNSAQNELINLHARFKARQCESTFNKNCLLEWVSDYIQLRNSTAKRSFMHDMKQMQKRENNKSMHFRALSSRKKR